MIKKFAATAAVTLGAAVASVALQVARMARVTLWNQPLPLRRSWTRQSAVKRCVSRYANYNHD